MRSFSAIISTALILNLLPSLGFSQNSWSTMAPIQTARKHLAASAANGKMYVFGGEGTVNNQMQSSVEMFDPATDSWVSKAAMPSALGFCNASMVNGIIYVIGGWNGSYQTNQNWAYDPVLDTWAVKANMPTIRSDAATAVVDGKIYAIGGWQYGSIPRNENEMYDPVTNTWTSKAPMPTARGYFSTAVVDGKIYAIGSGPTARKLEMYDPATNVWATKADLPLSKAGHCSVVINNEIYVFGGSNNNADTTLVYSPSTNTWRTAEVLPTHRIFVAATYINGEAYVVGGQDFTAIATQKNERFGPYATKIFFSAKPKNGTYYSIYTMNPDGTGRTKLFNDNYHRRCPILSNSGKKIFYLKKKFNLENEGDSTWICRASTDGTGEEILWTNTAPQSYGIRTNFAVSPDNTKLLFATYYDGWPIYLGRDGDVFEYNLITHALTNLTNDWDFCEVDPSYSPDGSKILYSKNGTAWYADPWPMYRMNADGTGNALFQPKGNGHYNSGPEYAPDGSKIAFCYDPLFSPQSLYICNADGTGTYQVIPSQGYSTGMADPTFNSSSDQLAFTRQNNTQLLITDLNGTVLHQADSTGINGFFEPAWGLIDPSPSPTASLVITASANPVCAGDTVTFTAHAANVFPLGGTWQWYVNGIPVSNGGNIGNGLVAHYPFNGNLSDATGHCQNAVPHGNVSPAPDRNGIPGHAFYIGGNSSGDDYLTVAHNDSLAVHNPFSVSVWINKEVHGGWIINKGRDIINGYGMYDAGCNAQVVYASNNGAGVTNNTVSLNTWHLYTGVINGDSAKFYLDGVLASTQLMASNSYTSTSNDYPLAFGRHFTYCCFNPSPSYWSYPFKGKIDDIRIYNRALSANEVWILYNGSDSTFSYVPQNGDSVYCVYTSGGNPSIVDTSNFIVMNVNPLPLDIGEIPATPSLQNGLVAWYPFNGNADDASGNGNNGILHGTAAGNDHCGMPNGALTFNGATDWIEVPNSPSLQSPTTALTISTWVKSNVQYIPFLCKINGPSWNIYQYRTLHNLSDKICTMGFNGSDYNSSMVASPGLGQWFHYTVTYNGSQVTFYINGIQDHQFSNSTVIIPNTERLEIARDAHGPIEWLNGQLDELRIYNRCLSPQEVLSLTTGCALAAGLTNDTICSAAATTALYIDHSQAGINYQLLKEGVNYGSSQTGNGGTLTFPMTGLTATSAFTIYATNPTTGCDRMLDTTLTVIYAPINAVVSSNSTVCPGIPVPLTASGGSGYLWSTGQTTASISVTPVATTTYYVTVSNAVGCWDKDSVKVTVNPAPVPTLSGPVAVCLGTNNAVYTTQAGMNGYAWTVTPGGTILSGQGTSSITVQWTTLGSQSVGVNYANSFGCMAASPTLLTVSVNPMAAPTITGSSSMCVSSGYYHYTTESGMNSYQWSVSPGATIIWGTGTNELIVTWDQPGVQWVRVNYTNSSGCSAVNPAQLDVTVNPLPGAAGPVTGPAVVCAGASGIAYSTTSIANTATYVWSLPPGATIASGAGTNAITVDFGPAAQPGSVSVYGNNLCGNGTPSALLSVSVGPLPGNAGTPVGEIMVCEGDTGVIYYTSPILNAVNYFWEITGGGVITTGNGTNSVRVTFPAGSGSGTIAVTGTNSCGQGATSSPLAVTVNPIPATPVITQSGETLISSAPSGNQWYLNGNLIPWATEQTYTPHETGTYSVRVTLFTCESAVSATYYFIMTGVNSSRPTAHFTIYPVPNDGLFNLLVQGSFPEGLELSVINELGIRILSRQTPAIRDEYQTVLDVRPAAPGLYTVLFSHDGHTWVKKVVVTR